MPQSESEVISYFDTLSNWGRWGSDDEMGTLNFITTEKRVHAASLVTEGKSVSCSRVISSSKEKMSGPSPFLHFMQRSGDAAADGYGLAIDWFGLGIHGPTDTHLDALSHIFWDQKTYNGRPSNEVNTERGAEFGSVEAAKTGFVSRGVLLDVPRSKGIPFLEPGYMMTPEDLEQCEASEGVVAESGDVLLTRTGRDVCPDWNLGHRSGYATECLPWLHDRQVSLLVGDGTHDYVPSPYPFNPIHAVGIVAIGLWLLDNAFLEDVAKQCAESKRWEFFFVASPLVLERSTGSPINPVAIF